MKVRNVAIAMVIAFAAPSVFAELGHSAKVGKEDWSKITHFTTEDKYVFSTQGDDCWKTDLDTGKSEKVAGKGWLRTTDLAATKVGDDIFLISLQGKECYVTHVATGNFAKIEAGDWSDTRCIDTWGTKLYSVNGKDCWETELNVDPPTSHKICAHEDWSKVRFFEIMGDNIYSVDDHLWATPLEGATKSKKLGADNWSKITQFAACNGGLWSIQGKNLYWTDPNDGTSKKIGNEDWSAVKFFAGSENGGLYSVVGKDLWKTETH